MCGKESLPFSPQTEFNRKQLQTLVSLAQTEMDRQQLKKEAHEVSCHELTQVLVTHLAHLILEILARHSNMVLPILSD